MRVGLVVPVALPCTPRGYGRGRGRRAAGRPGPRTGPPGGYTSHTGTTRAAVDFGESCARLRSLLNHSPTAISTSVTAESEISEAATKRGLMNSRQAEVTHAVTG